MKPIAIIIVCALGIVACAGEETVEQRALRSVFSDYQQALESRDVDGALRILDDDAMVLFDTAAALARELSAASQEDTASNPAPTLFVQLLARRALASGDVASGRQLFAAAVSRGDLAPGTGRFGLESIKVKETTASAKLTLDGQALRTKVTFALKDGRWRLSLTSVANGINAALEAFARQLELSDEAWLEQVVPLPAPR